MMRYKKYGLLILCALLGVIYFYSPLWERFSPYVLRWLSPTALLSHQHDAGLLTDIPHLVKTYGPAVVSIQVSQLETNPLNQLVNKENQSLSDNDPFFDFFHRFTPPESDTENHAIAYGSGFIIDPKGYVLTSAHLVKAAQTIKVILTDRREWVARLIGIDTVSDVALLKITAADLPVVKIGEPAKLNVGEWVVAIGSPFGFEHSTTAGIVSATKRTLPNSSLPFIQTDVAINLGNSGGPLFNLHGEVVGMNAQIYSRSGEFIGISFAIPIDIAIEAAHQIQKTGQAKHGQLGVYVQPITQSLANAFKLDRPRGVLVKKIVPQSPASNAGVQVGDILLSLDDQSIDTEGDLLLYMAKILPQQKITLTLWRYGQKKSIQIVLDECPIKNEPIRSIKKKTLATLKPQQRLDALGLVLSPLNAWQKKQLGLNRGGLLVNQSTGMAAEAGLMRGDIIIGLNHHTVVTVQQLRQGLALLKRDAALLIQRGHTVLFIPLTFR